MVASAGAAALTTLAVTVAVPALGDDGSQGPSPDALATCLAAHGLDGAPGGDALKPWLGRLLDSGDATAQDALKACAPKQGPDTATKPGADAQGRAGEEQLRSCLKDHGADAPDEATMDLKRWIFAHRDEAATVSALKSCGVSFDTGPAGGGCAKPVGPDGAGVPGDRADKSDPAPALSAEGAVTSGT